VRDEFLENNRAILGGSNHEENFILPNMVPPPGMRGLSSAESAPSPSPAVNPPFDWSLLFLPFVFLSWGAGFVVAIWSYVLCFQVNGWGAGGWISFLLTLLLPVVAQFLWAIWALVHGHAYLWAFVASVAFFFLSFPVALKK
jgi:hypothetical protein